MAYLRRRFLPLEPTPILLEHIVSQADRLDNIAYQYLDDPEQFWRICDANVAMNPHWLTAEVRIGRRLNIPLVQGA